jgi:hypothetical protein
VRIQRLRPGSRFAAAAGRVTRLGMALVTLLLDLASYRVLLKAVMPWLDGRRRALCVGETNTQIRFIVLTDAAEIASSSQDPSIHRLGVIESILTF